MTEQKTGAEWLLDHAGMLDGSDAQPIEPTYFIRPIRWEVGQSGLIGITFLGVTYRVAEATKTWFTTLNLPAITGSGPWSTYEDAIEQVERHWQMRIGAGLIEINTS